MFIGDLRLMIGGYPYSIIHTLLEITLQMSPKCFKRRAPVWFNFQSAPGGRRSVPPD
jgi:hypothetical protein